MSKDFILDLKAARRRSGLTQADCGHLLDLPRKQAAALERGERRPTLKEICALSLIFGRTFESLYSVVFDEVRREIAANLETLPEKMGYHGNALARRNALHALKTRLLDESTMGYGE